jgi:hypothetical protein
MYPKACHTEQQLIIASDVTCGACVLAVIEMLLCIVRTVASVKYISWYVCMYKFVYCFYVEYPYCVFIVCGFTALAAACKLYPYKSYKCCIMVLSC